MGRLLWPIACAALIIACDGGDPRTSAQLQALYDRAAQETLQTRDAAGLERTHGWLDTPDCRYQNSGSSAHSWPEMRGFMLQDLTAPPLEFSNRIQRVSRSGATATAVVNVRSVARIADEAGRFGPRGAPHVVETTATVRDRWVQTSDGWRRSFHEKIVPNRIVSVDGRPWPR